MAIKDLTAKQRAELRLDPKVTIGGAERLLDRIAQSMPRASGFTLDCSSSSAISPGAGFRLGNALRLASSIGPLVVLVPAGQYASDKVATDFFFTFTRSGLGPAIARYAHRVEAEGKDVTASLKAYYERTLTVPAQTSLYVTDLHLGVIDTEDENRFGRVLAEALMRVSDGVAGIERDPLARIIGLCFEAVQNIVDHAGKKPFNGASLFSYLSIRYYKKIFSSDDGLLTTYFNRARKDLGNRQWLEILVNDDGVGIPARQSQTTDIYKGPLSEE